MLFRSKKVNILFGKQGTQERQRFLATVFTGVLIVSAILIFSTKPAVIPVAARADTGKRAACKAIPKTIFFRSNNGSQGIAPPPPPIRKYYKPLMADTLGTGPFDFRASPFRLVLFSFNEPDCDISGTCFGGCAGSMSCVDGAQALSADGCNWKCCWCGTGNCSDFRQCGT